MSGCISTPHVHMNIHVFSAYFSAHDSSGHYLRSLRLFGTIFRLSVRNFCFVTLITERHEIVDLHSVTLLFQKSSHFWHFPHFVDKSTLEGIPLPGTLYCHSCTGLGRGCGWWILVEISNPVGGWRRW